MYPWAEGIGLSALIKIETYWNVNHSISKQYPIK